MRDLQRARQREVPRATCNERGARSFPRRICRASPIIGTLHKASCDRVLLRNHGSLSYLVILSERIKHESLRTDKRKTAWSFFKSRLIRANPPFLLQKKVPLLYESRIHFIFPTISTNLFGADIPTVSFVSKSCLYQISPGYHVKRKCLSGDDVSEVSFEK